MLPKTIALLSTVLLLMSLGFFVLSSTPLLILKHEVPMDSRVIRQVFHYCYRLVAIFAITGSLAYAMTGRPLMSLTLGCIGTLALALHHWVLRRMDALRTTMHDGDTAAVARFRRLHVAGIAINVVQLVAAGIAVTQLTL